MPYFTKNFIFRLDALLGLRTQSIVAYGMLPATLVYLGVIKIDKNALPNNLGYLELLAIFVVFSLPTFIMIKLVSSRIDRYYLLSDHAVFRSVLTTLEIYLGSMVVCLATGILYQGQTAGSALTIDSILNNWSKWMVDTFIAATASLAVSSTLISSVLTNKVSLPGMPPLIIEESFLEIKKGILELTRGEAGIQWGAEPNKNFIEENRKKIDALIKQILALNAFFYNNKGFSKFLGQVVDDLKVLYNALYDIKSGASWEKYLNSDTSEKAKNIKRLLKSNWIKTL